jgi:ribosomal protein L11 methylase PrmA
MIIEIIAGLIGLFLFFWLFIFGIFVFGAPYQPSNKKQIERMVRLSGVKKGDRVVELGSGDGRVVIGLARRGAEVVGYEVNPLLVWISRRRIKKAGVNAKIYWKSFWNVNLSGFDVIVMYQVFSVMGRLRRKVKREFKGKIISNTWKFHGWKPVSREGNVFLYKV